MITSKPVYGQSLDDRPSSHGVRHERLIVTPNDVSALRVTCGRGRLHFGPVNHIEMRYEIVEGGQNGSGVWLDNGSIRFRAGELSYCVHRFPKRQHNKFDRIAQRVAEQVGSPMSFDGAQRRKHLRSGVPNIFVSFFDS